MSRIVPSDSEFSGASEHLRTTPAEAQCDAIRAAFRAGESRTPIPGESPLPLEPADDELKLRLAEELDYARRMLDVMGDELAADMGVVMRHSVALQSVDIVGQMLGHIANVIRALDAEAAVDRIGMCDLKARLTRSDAA